MVLGSFLSSSSSSRIHFKSLGYNAVASLQFSDSFLKYLAISTGSPRSPPTAPKLSSEPVCFQTSGKMASGALGASPEALGLSWAPALPVRFRCPLQVFPSLHAGSLAGPDPSQTRGMQGYNVPTSSHPLLVTGKYPLGCWVCIIGSLAANVRSRSQGLACDLLRTSSHCLQAAG